jgi:hypothetical protein
VAAAIGKGQGKTKCVISQKLPNDSNGNPLMTYMSHDILLPKNVPAGQAHWKWQWWHVQGVLLKWGESAFIAVQHKTVFELF